MTTESAMGTKLSLEPPPLQRQGLGAMASGLIGSEILKIAGDVRAMKRSGKPMCDLTVGDFSPREFRIPRILEEGIAAALAAGQTNYPPSDGILELRQAVQALYARALHLEYPVEGVLIAGGARPVIWSDPGDWMLKTAAAGPGFRYRNAGQDDDDYLQELLR